MMIKTAVILAGGKSARFGTPKSLVPVDGIPLVAWLTEQIKKAGIDNIYLSTDETDVFSSIGFECILDEYKESGPLAGIHSALKKTRADSILVLSCDMPKITSDEIAILLNSAIESDADLIYVSTPLREHPLCAVYKKGILPAITNALEKRNLSVLDFCHEVKSELVFFNDETPFLNLNSPDDMKPEKNNTANPDVTVERPIQRYHRIDGIRDIKDILVRESFIRIWVNDDEVAVINALKDDVENLAVGFLYTECIINDIEKITSIEFNDKLDTVTVNTKEKIKTQQTSLVRTVSPGCGNVLFSIRPAYADCFKAVGTDVQAGADRIIDMMNSLMKTSGMFHSTGGVHTSALSDGERIIHVADDIARHNTIDKILGHELRFNEIPQNKRMILTSGRIATGAVTKAIRGHAPFLVSHSAPSDGAVQLADKFGITLVGFARGARFNIYTHSQRIKT
jgi:FdhD protein